MKEELLFLDEYKSVLVNSLNEAKEIQPLENIESRIGKLYEDTENIIKTIQSTTEEMGFEDKRKGVLQVRL